MLVLTLFTWFWINLNPSFPFHFQCVFILYENLLKALDQVLMLSITGNHLCHIHRICIHCYHIQIEGRIFGSSWSNFHGQFLYSCFLWTFVFACCSSNKKHPDLCSAFVSIILAVKKTTPPLKIVSNNYTYFNTLTEYCFIIAKYY